MLLCGAYCVGRVRGRRGRGRRPLQPLARRHFKPAGIERDPPRFPLRRRRLPGGQIQGPRLQNPPW